jgi:hypothetical protein
MISHLYSGLLSKIIKKPIEKAAVRLRRKEFINFRFRFIFLQGISLINTFN